jgi:porin
LAFLFSTAAAARDPDWYGDVQYLTWDETMEAPCESDAAGDSGMVQIQPPSDDVFCNACDRDGCQPSLTRDWQSRMTCLCKTMKDQGISYNVVVPQFYQGVTSGGNDTGFEYGGKVDQFLTLDSTKLGLWQGMTMTLHAETRFGEDVNFEAVGLAPVNVAMLYPRFDQHETAITGLSFAQALNEDVQVTFGKFNALDMFYMLYPETGRGVNGFMNASMVVPLALARIFPLSFMGAGVMTLHGTQVESSVMVYDPHNVATTSGFDELGDNGANIMGFYRFFTNVGGLPGSVLFGGVGATGEFVAFDSGGFIIVPDEGIVAPTQHGTWALFYIQQQTLWADRCNPERKIGLLSQWSIADEKTCPYLWTANVGIQGQGLVGGRPQDTLGVGYFYNGLSDEFENLLSPVLDLHDVSGVELYYSAALAKCFALTADLQVIEPAEVSLDTALVFGLRGTIAL